MQNKDGDLPDKHLAAHGTAYVICDTTSTTTVCRIFEFRH